MVGGGGMGGSSVGQMCAATQHNCSGTCVDNNSTAHCGTLCDPCVAPAGGTATCDGSKCDFTCGSMKKCVGKCTSGCCADTDCPAQAGKAGKCDTSTNVCNYDCAVGFKPCGVGTCIPMASCCSESDCAGPCKACGAAGACVAVTGADDLDSCNGTCDATGACKSKKGQTCQTGTGGCIAGTTCAPDGYCCDRACTNSCEACDLTGFLGTCTPLASGTPHGNRASCTGTATECAGTCAGRTDGLCSFPTGTCGSATCSGASVIGKGTCASGACVPPAAQACANGFGCAAGACKTTCTTSDDCHPDYFCESTNAKCHSDVVSVACGSYFLSAPP